MSRYFGLLGHHLTHSFSPLIHKCLGDYEYRIFDVPATDLGQFMNERRFAGINVTIPYKQAVTVYCSSLSKEAEAVGSVNTIVKDDKGLLHGHNTDCRGFRQLLSHARVNPAGRQKVLVLGDGGAAKAVRYVLAELGASKVVTISRRGKDHYDNIKRHYNAKIIINTTPVGMYPNNGESPLSLAGFTKLEAVIDLIYNPARTALMLEAERLGISCTGGLIMLTEQAKTAAQLFADTYTDICLAPDCDIVNVLTKKMQNIVLIGMPGCGKSTAGRKLAEIMKRPFADTDELIETQTGMPVPMVIQSRGIDTFRDIERHVLAEECKKCGYIIATGGGVVTQMKNYNLLRQNSIIVYLRRDIGELSLTGRPISQSAGVDKLARERLPQYESWCDHTIDVDSDPNITAKKILEAIE